MSESARLALSYLRSRAERFGVDLERLDQSNLHLHFPSGAIKKDGPSAGIAIACAFLSALTGRPAPTDVAMTGELTVVGEVLAIGGVREKVLAAKNFGLSRVILPKANEPEAKELKRELVRGIKFSFVEHFDEVWDVVFGGQDKPAGTKSTAGRKKASRAAGRKAAPKQRVTKKKTKVVDKRKAAKKSKPQKKTSKKAAKKPAVRRRRT